MRPRKPPRRRRKPLRALILAALLATTLTATGCGDSDDASNTPGASGASGASEASGKETSNSPSPHTTSPEDLCTILITKWGRQLYDSGKDTYGDYQSMGLSNGQYMILRDVLDAARAERRRHGAAAGRQLMARQAREKCDKRYESGAPTDGPWV